MRFSIFHVPTSLGPEDDATVIKAVVDESVLADELGFAAVFLPEHHFTNYSPSGSDPMLFAAHLAGKLKQAWVGFAIVVTALNNPVRMVERMNLLDQLTGGKVIFALGSGFHPVEFAGLGMHPQDARSGVGDANLETALKLWAMKPGDPPFEYQNGPYHGLVLNRVMPAPLTQPHPLLMGTASREAGVRRAARNGWPVFFMNSGDPDDYENLIKRLRLYRQGLAEAGHAPEVLARCLDWSSSHSILTVVADTDEEAMAKASVCLEGHKRNLVRQHAWTAQALLAHGLEPPTALRFNPTSRSYIDQACLIGSPDTVSAKLQRLADVGVGLANMSFNLGMPQDAERRAITESSMRLFAAEVAPRFTSQAAPTDPLAIDLDMVERGLAPDVRLEHVV